MGLLTKRSFHGGEHVTESRRVRGIGECLECGSPFSCRKIQFACTTLSNVDGNDSSDFLSEWLNGNWRVRASALSHRLPRSSDLHG